MCVLLRMDAACKDFNCSLPPVISQWFEVEVQGAVVPQGSGAGRGIERGSAVGKPRGTKQQKA